MYFVIYVVQKLASIIPIGKDDIYLRVPPFYFFFKYKTKKYNSLKKRKKEEPRESYIERRDWNYLSDNFLLNRCSCMYVCVYVHVQKRQNVLEHKEDEKKGGGIKIKKGNRQETSEPRVQC